MTPQSLLSIQCCSSMVHINEAVGVESYRLPGNFAGVMNVIIVSCRTFVHFSNVIILTVFSTVIRGALHENIVFKWRSLFIMCE